MEICKSEKPELMEVSPGHKVACHKWKGEQEKLCYGKNNEKTGGYDSGEINGIQEKK